MFKRGDKVRRIQEIKPPHNLMKIGDVDTIEGISKDLRDRETLSLIKFGKGHSSEYFELVREEESEFSYQLSLIAKEFMNA